MKHTPLANKKIILCITGSIAAYKAAFLTRLFIKAGAEVKVIMTDAAAKFISPLTLSTLSKNPVYTEVTNGENWNNHVELGLWADAMVIAPTTATTLGKLAHAICDSMVVATYLSARCPVFFAPAMDLDMWKHPATQRNVQLLLAAGNHLIPVGEGELASGLVGAGRMAEPEEISSFLSDFFQQEGDFQGKDILITAGPTYEPIDPVRFIGNRSSGKMGISIANELATRGARVTLILGPSKLSPSPKVHTIRIQTAQEMYEVATREFSKCHAAIMSAAVADYRPAVLHEQKVKKKADDMNIALVKNPDIAATLGKSKKDKQVLVGFALETNNEIANAQEKIKKKNFDFIVLNSLQDAGAGFNHDTNKITIIDSSNNIEKYQLKSKKAVAKDIANTLLNFLK